MQLPHRDSPDDYLSVFFFSSSPMYTVSIDLVSPRVCKELVETPASPVTLRLQLGYDRRRLSEVGPQLGTC